MSFSTMYAPLIDMFGRAHTHLRVSLTDRCNLRCAYCMPPEGVKLKPRKDILSFDEIGQLVRVFAESGITKVRLTGGEPLVRRGIVDLVALLSEIGGIDTLAMTTNGILLEQHAAALRAAGLARLNISLDTMRADRFAKLTRRYDFDKTLGGIEAALEHGFAPLKINMVVMRGFNDDELEDFVEFTRGRPIEVRFIEYMPFQGNQWDQAGLVSYDEIIARLSKRYELIAQKREHPSAPAESFKIPGFQGGIGIIASMTQSFCAQCSRLRLTAEGTLKTCLFHNAECSLRDAMREGCGGEALAAIIRQAVLGKQEGHASLDVLADQPNRSMVQIGG